MSISFRRKAVVAILGATLTIAGCTRDARSTEARSTEMPAKTELQLMVSDAERDFLRKAAQGGLTEVELGRAAEEQGQNGGVKNLGKMLISDHRKNNEELMRLAVIKDVPLPMEPNSEQRGIIDQIWEVKGAAFDKQFLKIAAEDHRKDIQQYSKMAQEAKDRDVKAFAERTLPVLQKHAEHVEKLMAAK